MIPFREHCVYVYALMFIRFKGDVNALLVDKRHFLISSSIVDVMGDVQIKRRFKNLKNKIKLVKREKM